MNNELIKNGKNIQLTNEIIKNAEKMYEYVDDDLNAACRSYLQELEKIKSQVGTITNEFSQKLFKMNKTDIVQGLNKNEINVETLKLESKSPDELIAIFNALGHYSFLGNTLDNTINNVIPTIIRYLDLKTAENSVINYIYSNLYDISSNEQIKEMFDNIKKNKCNIDREYEYYSELYKEKFGKKAFISNPGGSKEQTINAIKESLKNNKDLLGEMLNSIDNDNLY